MAIGSLSAKWLWHFERVTQNQYSKGTPVDLQLGLAPVKAKQIKYHVPLHTGEGEARGQPCSSDSN